MAKASKNKNLDFVIEKIGIRANVLAKTAKIDHSLLTKWRRGERPLKAGNRQLPQLAAALLELDTEGNLEDTIELYRDDAKSDVDALCAFLTSEELPGLIPRTAPPKRKLSGEYTVTHRIYLGKKGLRNATVTALDYIMKLPPGQDLVVVMHGNFDWVVGNLPYMLILLSRLKKVFVRGTTLTVISRQGFSTTDVKKFAGPWMAAHLQGYIRSLYYEGDMPPGDRLVGSIRGYLSFRAREDDEVEDGLFGAMYSDPLDIRQDIKTCDEYRAKAKALAHYNLLVNPLPITGRTDTGFVAITSVPFFGAMTQKEYHEITKTESDSLDPLFYVPETPPNGSVKLILCREDIQKMLQGERSKHEALSVMLKRRIFISKKEAARQLTQIRSRMSPEFEVALVPKTAFRRIGLELIAYKDGAMVAWLPDYSNSVFSDDYIMSDSLYNFGMYTWKHLRAGWRDQVRVGVQLNKWLRGEDLDHIAEDTGVVRSWDILSD